jgi:hypothetical protein
MPFRPFFLLTLLILPLRAYAAQVSDAANHFSLTLPADWSPLTAADLATLPAGDTQGFVAGAHANDQVPYCLIDVLPRTFGSTEGCVSDIQARLAETQESTTTCISDNNRHSLIIRARLKNGTSLFSDSCYAFIGSNNIVCIHCYDFAAVSDDHRPIFDALADSFHFDAGYGYKSFLVDWSLCIKTGEAIVGILAVGYSLELRKRSQHAKREKQQGL